MSILDPGARAARSASWLLALALLAAVGPAARATAADAPAKGAAAPSAAGGGDAIAMQVGDKKLTQKELAAELEWEPEPLLAQVRSDDNFARIYAIRWFHAEVFAAAARDDGLLKRKQGLEGAASNLGRNLIASEYREDLMAVEYKPTDNEIQQYYVFNKEACTTPARYHLARAGVQVAKHASQAEVDGAQKRLAEIQARLAKGDSLAAVADELSDLPAKGPGGDAGWLTDEDLAKDPDSAWIKDLAVGTNSDVKKTPRGLEIFRMVEKQPAQVKTAAECRPILVDRIRREYYKTTTERRAEELTKRYNASMNLDAFLAAARGAKGREMPQREPSQP